MIKWLPILFAFVLLISCNKSKEAPVGDSCSWMPHKPHQYDVFSHDQVSGRTLDTSKGELDAFWLDTPIYHVSVMYFTRWRCDSVTFTGYSFWNQLVYVNGLTQETVLFSDTTAQLGYYRLTQYPAEHKSVMHWEEPMGSYPGKDLIFEFKPGIGLHRVTYKDNFTNARGTMHIFTRKE